MSVEGLNVLGIESSCDETAAAVVADGRRVLSNVVHSQIHLHERFRGVVPEVASRSHMTRVLPVISDALAGAGVTPGGLAAIAVTNRPGMVGSLLVGIAAAKALAWSHGLPLIGVDHIQAHVHAAFMAEPALRLPCLTLVASGGHTALYLLHEPGRAERLGRTIDDAAGEALDKGAALLGLPYPGGPSIQTAARQGDPRSIDLPRPMLGETSLDFSFSGLKTALLYHLRGPGLAHAMPSLSPQQVADCAAAYQAAVVDTLIRKLRRAAERVPGLRSLSIGGGVARNELLRQRLREDSHLARLQLVFPPLELCSDNGAMIAGLGHHLWHERGQVDDLSLDARATSRSDG
ncbi:MAG: tRNA (adenosine(37)-N6)-threonylcarbamoyltransferase complex transferase subunit TsaD [Planctomycetes bacterium]|nr:tRNA (adenosine(37)-N6)-threonylcarbamoyltransferase complex transferase subunit TsaD [Planctomycetota bacterium]